MQIELKVHRAPTGRYTLMMRKQNEMQYSDCVGELRSNADTGSFYKAVALTLHTLHINGDEVNYRDHI